MESIDDTTRSISSKMGFFKHVFNFDDNSKAEILNIIQYALISIIPIIILNKLSQKYVPEADEEKSSLEIIAEVIMQVLVIFMGLLLINRSITYIPTYSGEKYPDFSITYIILAVLMITLSLQTKLGEKVSILYDRVSELWGGSPDSDSSSKKNKNKGKGKVKVSQPISGGGGNQGQMNPQMEQSLYSTPINQLPITSSISQQQSSPDYDSMYQNTNTPMVGAASPGGMEAFVPLAANDGGVAFGSAFGGGF
jgi:hypothetical protein